MKKRNRSAFDAQKVIDRLNRESEERVYMKRSMENRYGTFQGDHAEQLATIGNTILKIQVVLSILLVVASIFPGISIKVTLVVLVLLPLPAYIFAFLFPDITQWIPTKERGYSDYPMTGHWKKTRVNMGAWYSTFSILIAVVEVAELQFFAQVYKGAGTLFVLGLSLCILFDLAGVLRIGFRGDRRTQILMFLLLNTIWIAIATPTVCYFFLRSGYP